MTKPPLTRLQELGQEYDAARPPINQYIEWDGSKGCPLPRGTDVTMWFSNGDTQRTNDPIGWAWWGEGYSRITAYLVHAYPPEDEVVDVWVSMDDERFDVDPDKTTLNAKDPAVFVHLRFTNGVAEIVSQEKA